MSEQKEQENIVLDKLKEDLKIRNYEYQTIIGRGSYGVVVKAKLLDEENTYAAIKCFKETVKYSKRELDILLEDDIAHENIVKYSKYWAMTIGETQFLCIQMECCRVNLRAFIYKNKTGAEIITSQGPPRFYQHVFPQILKGLCHIHDLGWVHRDIHPSNILIADPNPEEIAQIVVKIADFGLARKIRSTVGESSSLTDGSKLVDLSTNIGNKDFRAPEMDDGHYDFKVDLYSAGIVLYFLSRYLEVQGLWKDEIKAFIDGKRRSEDLYHQDDKHLARLIWLLMQKREKRPTAKEALKIAEKLGESEGPVESQILVEPKKLQFLVRKDGERASHRCWIKVTNLTSDNLKAKIEKRTGIKTDSQVLYQKTNDAGLINITFEGNIQNIFEAETPVVIIASDSTEVGNRDVKKFRARNDSESLLQRCSTKDNTLSSLKAEIQNRFGVKAESQVLTQCQTTSSGQVKSFAINDDNDVKEMFESAERREEPPEIVVSDVNRVAEMFETNKFFITKQDGKLCSKRGSIKECTLPSLKEEITRRTNIPTDLQVLHQQKVINNIHRFVPIESDEDVDGMFNSSDKWNPVDLLVSEYHTPVPDSEHQTDAGNDTAKTFLIKKDGVCEPFTRLTIKNEDLNLPTLKNGIKEITEIESDDQELYEKTQVFGQPELIHINDEDFKVLSKRGGEIVIIVSKASESLEMFN